MTEHDTIDRELAANTERNRYRRAFLATLFVAVILAGGVAGLWWRMHTTREAQVERPTMAATNDTARPQPASRVADTASPAAAQQTEAPLAPMQLSPRRMQSIGIVIGRVEYKPISDELRFYGNVQINERRVAYVQTRFAGWIHQVYADATGEFVRKGQPLFTIYSQDLH